MNNWIKYLELDELKEFYKKHDKEPKQRLMGFFRKSKKYVLYCSICEEDDGTFEYYYNCNKDVAYSFIPNNNFKTFQECKDALVEEVKGLSDKQAPMWGLSLNETTENHQIMWDLLGIEEEYPAYYGGYGISLNY